MGLSCRHLIYSVPSVMRCVPTALVLGSSLIFSLGTLITRFYSIRPTIRCRHLSFRGCIPMAWNLYRLHVQLTNSCLFICQEQLAHINHMNHGSQFQQLWSKLRSEVLGLQQRGYYGDGAYIMYGSIVRRVFLNVMPSPSPTHRTPQRFYASDASGCVTLTRLFRNLSHCLIIPDGLYRLIVGSDHAILSFIVVPVLGPHKTALGKQAIGLQASDFQIRLPLRDT